MAKTRKGKGNAARLARYWEKGTGAAKVRWGAGGDFNRCVSHLRKYLRDPKGYCALRHKRATGMWPAQHAKRTRKRR